MTRPIVFIGLDAAVHGLLTRWAADGHLPTMARLLADGHQTPTLAPDLFYVGAVWPTFATGLSAGRHGRHNWKHLRPGSYDFDVVHTRAEMEATSFWDVVGDAGRRVAVVDVPLSLDSPAINGLQVLEWGGHDPELGFATHPTGAAADIAERFGAWPVAHPCNSWDRTPEHLADLTGQLVDGAARKGELVRWVWRQEPWDLFVAVFGEPHCVGHQCWHLLDDTHPWHDPAEVEHLGNPILATYQAIDTAIGRLLAEVGDDALVLLWASHGMGGHYDPTVLNDRVLLALDAAYEQEVAARRLRARVGRLDPRRRRDRARRLALLEGDDPAQVPMAERRFFDHPNNHADAGIRLNLAGREPEGRVHPDEADEVMAFLVDRLAGLRDADTGAPLVRDVTCTRDRYPEAHPRLPDLVIRWNREGWVRAVTLPGVGPFEGGYPGPRSGDHTPEGLLVATGPGVQPGRTDGVFDVTDLAPTLAAAFGAALPEADGRVRRDLLDAWGLPTP